MRIAIVYFSLTGNTRKVADILNVGDTELIEVKSTGFSLLSLLGFIRHPKFDPVMYDLVVIGCPVWSNNPAKPFIIALRRMEFRGKQVNLFVTYALKEGKSLKKLSHEVERRAGSVGRMMAIDVSKELDEGEIRKLLSF